MCTGNDWLQLLVAGLTPVTAIATIAVSWRQYRIERRRDRRESYDRKHRVFAGVINYLRAVSASSSLADSEFVAFVEATSEVPFIFSDSIRAYVDELYRNGVTLVALDRTIKSGQSGDIKLAGEKLVELREWFRRQFEDSVNIFRKEMAIDK